MTEGNEPFSVALARLAGEDPDRPALTVGDVTLTRSELDRHSNRLARAFSAEGVGHDDLVTIALPNSVDFVATAIACWKLGAIPQPVSWRSPLRELRTIVALADPALVVGVDCDAVPGRAVWTSNRVPDPDISDGPLPPVMGSSWKAPTSGGSTGRPKLILSGERPLVPTEPKLGLQPNGCVVIPGPLYHNAPFTVASYGLVHGNHVVVLPAFDARATLEAIHEHRPDFIQLVPTMMVRILRLPESERAEFDLSSLRRVWHMGAPCPGWAKEAWLRWLNPEVVWELYAGTEAQAATMIRGDEWLERRGSVGRVTVGEMRVVDPESHAELPPGAVGEVYLRPVSGASPSYRYIGAEPRAIADGWESLGDMGWFDEDGYLFLTDRRTDMIVSGGANIYPAEVEAALSEHPNILSCAVIGLPDEDLGQVVHAVLQRTAGDRVPRDDELRAFLADRLVRYKIPRRFEWVDQPVRDDAGKVRRSALREERLAR